MSEKKTKVETIQANEYQKSSLQFYLPNSDFRWSRELKPMLMCAQKGLRSLSQFQYCLDKFAAFSHNPEVRAATLEQLFIRKASLSKIFLNKLFPFIVGLVLDIEKHFPEGKLPVIPKNRKLLIRADRKAVASLVACSFLCLLDEARSKIRMLDYNMSLIHQDLRSGVMEHKMLCYLQYFSTLLNKMPEGEIIIGRNTITENLKEVYIKSKLPLTKVHLKETGTIEDNSDAIIVDFANMYVGGGCMESGCVQEELMFLKYPELLAARIFNEVMDHPDSILIKGVEKYNEIEGYAWDFKFAGPAQKDVKPCDTVIVAIDALDFSGGAYPQFAPPSVFREILKSHSGFSSTLMINEHCKRAVATGRWGCGAFRGDSQLKLMVQWLAASQLGREIIFYSRGDKTLKDAGIVIDKLKGLTVGELMHRLFDRLKACGDVHDLFTIILAQ